MDTETPLASAARNQTEGLVDARMELTGWTQSCPRAWQRPHDAPLPYTIRRTRNSVTLQRSQESDANADGSEHYRERLHRNTTTTQSCIVPDQAWVRSDFGVLLCVPSSLRLAWIGVGALALADCVRRVDFVDAPLK